MASVLTFGNNESTKFLSQAAKEDKILQPKARRQPTAKMNLLGINEEQKYDFDNNDKVLATLQMTAAAGVAFSSRGTNSNEEKEKKKMKGGLQCFEWSGREMVVDGVEEEVKETSFTS